MSKTRQTKLKGGHNVIMVDKQSGLTHVLASHRVRIPSDEVKEKVDDLVVIENPCAVTTSVPTKNEFSFRDESVESSEVVDKAFDEAFPEEEQPPLFCPICGGLLREARRGNYEFIQCASCSLAVQGYDNDDPETAYDEAWNNARFFLDHCPPVLRLQPGAEIQYFDGMFRRHTGIVAGRTRVSMRILLEDGRSIEPGNIVEWPWGMEQAE